MRSQSEVLRAHYRKKHPGCWQRPGCSNGWIFELALYPNFEEEAVERQARLALGDEGVTGIGQLHHLVPILALPTAAGKTTAFAVLEGNAYVADGHRLVRVFNSDCRHGAAAS